uniref:Uncharacterized protein n=1 Tax=Hyaloperonospora arabidopsidis (strain Emoy2) TaxID=559515 RepID=M4BFJ0_HYAAE
MTQVSWVYNGWPTTNTTVLSSGKRSFRASGFSSILISGFVFDWSLPDDRVHCGATSSRQRKWFTGRCTRAQDNERVGL